MRAVRALPAGGSARLLAAGAGAAAALGGCATVTAGLSAGAAGAGGAAAATVVVILFFLTGAAPVLLVDQRGGVNPVALPLVLGSYLLRVVAVAVLASRLAGTTGFDRAAFGLTAVGASLAWLAAVTLAALRGGATAVPASRAAAKAPARRPPKGATEPADRV